MGRKSETLPGFRCSAVWADFPVRFWIPAQGGNDDRGEGFFTAGCLVVRDKVFASAHREASSDLSAERLKDDLWQNIYLSLSDGQEQERFFPDDLFSRVYLAFFVGF